MSGGWTPAQRDLLCKILDLPTETAHKLRLCEFDGNPNLARSLEAIADFEANAQAELVEALRALLESRDLAVSSGNMDWLDVVPANTARLLLTKIDGDAK